MYKAYHFTSEYDLVQYLNSHKIQKEKIVSICHSDKYGGLLVYLT